jgi:hypothetical protein
MIKTTSQIENAIKLISTAAQEAVRTISAAAAEAKAVVNVNAADAARVLATTNSGDHDLLQRVDTKVDALIITVDKISLRDNLFVTQTEHNEVIKVTTDHETRIRIIETNVTRIVTWGTALVIFVGILEFLIRQFVKVP